MKLTWLLKVEALQGKFLVVAAKFAKSAKIFPPPKFALYSI